MDLVENDVSAFLSGFDASVFAVGKRDTFGEDMRLSRKRHTGGDPDEYTSGYGVKALSYCDMHTITLAALMAVLDDYPEFADDFLRQFVVTFSIQREVGSRRVFRIHRRL